jgi:hypothetical protein
MWKFRSMVLRSITKNVDSDTGDITDVTTDEAIDGFIVPTSHMDAFTRVNGFQQGMYACFCTLPREPVVDRDHIIDGSNDYLIKGFEYWQEKDLYILEVKK